MPDFSNVAVGDKVLRRSGFGATPYTLCTVTRITFDYARLSREQRIVLRDTLGRMAPKKSEVTHA